MRVAKWLGAVSVIAGVLAVLTIGYRHYVHTTPGNPAMARVGDLVVAAKAWSTEHLDAEGRPQWPRNPLEAPEIDLTPTREWTFDFFGEVGDANDPAVGFTVWAIGFGRMQGVRMEWRVAGLQDMGKAVRFIGLE